MRIKLVSQVLPTTMVASLLAYLINQLPAVPDFPYKNHIMVGAVVAVTLIAALVAFWQKRHSDKQTAVTDLPQQSARPRFQAELLRRVNEEVDSRLAQSLHNAVLIDLDKQIQPEQVQRPWDAEIKIGTKPAELLPPETKILSVFNHPEIKGKLLILGEPGSGKTTTLLDLAAALVKEAENDPTAPIPVLVNLSTWRDSKQSMPEWLAEELYSKYGVRKNLGNQWLTEKQLLPLLDGLDEVKPENQKSCAQAINQWLNSETRPTSIAICCRREEYETVVREHWEEANHHLEPETRLQLDGAILLQPLTDQKIQRYLSSTNKLELWQTLQDDPVLLKLVRIPLLLNVTLLSYESLPISQWQKLTTTEQRLEILLDAYAEKMFCRDISINTKGGRQPSKSYGKKELPTRKQTRQWLTWLAQHTTRESQSDFLIESLQPPILSDQENVIFVFTYALFYGLPMALFIALFISLRGIPINPTEHILGIGFAAFLATTLHISYLSDKEGKYYKIAFFERLTWSPSSALNGLIRYFKSSYWAVANSAKGITLRWFCWPLLIISSIVIMGYFLDYSINEGLFRVHTFSFMYCDYYLLREESSLFHEDLYCQLIGDLYVGIHAVEKTIELTSSYIHLVLTGCTIPFLIAAAVDLLSKKRKKRLGTWMIFAGSLLLFYLKTMAVWLAIGAGLYLLSILTVEIVFTSSYKVLYFLSRTELHGFYLVEKIVFPLFALGIFAIYIYLLFALFWLIILGFQERELTKKEIANQAMWNTFRSSFDLIKYFIFAFGICFMLVWLFPWMNRIIPFLGLNAGELDFFEKEILVQSIKSEPFYVLSSWVKFGLMNGVLVGTIVAYNLGIKSLIQHFTLRIILCRKGCIPWNYARFLDYCTERMLLQRVGGRYRFIHKSLQEHFASMSK